MRAVCRVRPEEVPGMAGGRAVCRVRPEEVPGMAGGRVVCRVRPEEVPASAGTMTPRANPWHDHYWPNTN